MERTTFCAADPPWSEGKLRRRRGGAWLSGPLSPFLIHWEPLCCQCLEARSSEMSSCSQAAEHSVMGNGRLPVHPKRVFVKSFKLRLMISLNMIKKGEHLGWVSVSDCVLCEWVWIWLVLWVVDKTREVISTVHYHFDVFICSHISDILQKTRTGLFLCM